jgi:predicted  nucleic acid-binding Zn-ribbon protein
MNTEETILPNLRRLAELEAARARLERRPATESLATEVEAVRAVLPTSILRHYEARRARGKLAVAPVTHGVCSACHLSIPRGRMLDLQRNPEGLNVCDHCGVFVYLPADAIEQPAGEAPHSFAKPARRRRSKLATKAVPAP